MNKKKKSVLGRGLGSILRNPDTDITTKAEEQNNVVGNISTIKISEISTLKNKDQSITDIEYKMDLSQKQSVDILSKDKFTSYLHFPN